MHNNKHGDLHMSVASNGIRKESEILMTLAQILAVARSSGPTSGAQQGILIGRSLSLHTFSRSLLIRRGEPAAWIKED